jgi:hypothetical protein
VRSVTSSTVTFDPPLPFDFSGMSAQVLPAHNQATVQGVGIESFTVDQSNITANFPSIQMGGVYGCWWYELELKNNPGRTVIIGTSVRCEFRRLYGHQTFIGGPNHEGLDFSNNSCWHLVEDNIFSPGTTPFFGDGGGHCMGNVVAYNYFSGFQGGTWDVTFNHGPHNMMNLVEGNIFQNSYKDDGYFGSSSHQTLFRNVIPDQVSLKHFCNYYNVVGNVLGATRPGPRQKRTYDAGESSNYWSNNVYPIYELGFPNIGNASHNGTFIGPTTPPDYHTLPNKLDDCQQLDRNVRATLIRHGNYDYVNKAVIWDPNISDRVIPDSLLYSSKPSWWDNSPWPPIGPDKNPMVGTIPAQNRMLGVSPTPAPTAAVPPTTAPRPSATPSSTQSPQVKKWKKKVKTGKWGRAKKNSGNQMPEGQEDISH